MELNNNLSKEIDEKKKELEQKSISEKQLVAKIVKLREERADLRK